MPFPTQVHCKAWCTKPGAKTRQAQPTFSSSCSACPFCMASCIASFSSASTRHFTFSSSVSCSSTTCAFNRYSCCCCLTYSASFSAKSALRALTLASKSLTATYPLASLPPCLSRASSSRWLANSASFPAKSVRSWATYYRAYSS